MNILIKENGLYIKFRIGKTGIVELTDFSSSDNQRELEDISEKPGWRKSHPIVELQISGQTTSNTHAYRHNAGSESEYLKYESHIIAENEFGKELQIRLKGRNGIRVVYYMQLYSGVAVARVWSEIENTGSDVQEIEYITSFIYDGISKNGNKPYYDKTDIYIPHNSWSSEAQWHIEDATDLGLSILSIDGYNLPHVGNNRYNYGSVGSWSTCQYLPIAIARDREQNEVYYGEVDYSGAWTIEYGSAADSCLYCAFIGPDDENQWRKKLKKGEKFTSVPVAFGVAEGNENAAIRELTKYRRKIRRKNKDNENCYVVFNDYMNCLMGDPTEKKEIQIIDKAVELGCEYYCMDCGWYDKGAWWDRVGEWKESEERFPNGLKRVFDYAKNKKIKMGLWLEIEVMGTECQLASTLPDNWFFCINGKRRVDNKRYLLDFRNPDVRKYCMDVVDRLINDYGASYFKIDYNVTTGPGSDIDSDSIGDAMLEHYRCLYDWYHELYTKHPDVIIENCGSGAQRMDYGMLEFDSLQSTSDQTDYVFNSYIAANVASAVTPEQAGMWVYPYEDDREHIIYNMVNGMLLRPYISGLVWTISEDNFLLFKDGINIYKQIRGNVSQGIPFFPLGFTSVKSDILAYGIYNKKKAYMSVFFPHICEGQIPLKFEHDKVKSIRIMYPKTEDCTYSYSEEKLAIKMPKNACARFFEIEFM